MASPARRAVALGLLLVVAACDTGDGRTLEPPPPGATAPPLATSTTTTTVPVLAGPPVGSEDVPAATLVLSSPSFADGAAIPARHASCGGENVSPALQWEGTPPETVELALTVSDPDAPDGAFVHWVVTGLSPDLLGMAEGAIPEGATEVTRWLGPCPPAGETHTYVFTLHALRATSGVAPGMSAEVAVDAIDAITAATATLSGTYGVPAGE